MQHVVRVACTQLWRTPDAPRSVDEPVLRAEPDHAEWLAAMDAATTEQDTRDGLEGRLDSEAVQGEPVDVHETRGAWSCVSLPWQPSRLKVGGYPGWVQSAHLSPAETQPEVVGETTSDVDALLKIARSHLGLNYLWGGTTDAGLDCSGLIMTTFRRLGRIVPRDAADQAAASEQVPLGQERPGDLYFFAHPGQDIHHVGFVTAAGRMLHAPMTGEQIVEEPLSAKRRETLVGVGRFEIAPLIAETN